MQITKQKLEKIFAGGILDPKDLTADEKKWLYAVMQQQGMSMSTAYIRFFSKGFSPWELLGVSQLRESFLITSPCCVDNHNTEEKGSRGYGYVLTLAKDYDDSKFYDIVTNLKMGVKLCEYMAEKGMLSPTTVRTRFKANDWKPWELMGVIKVLQDAIQPQ